MLTYKIMFQIFFVPKYFLVLKAVIFGTLLPEHPVRYKALSQLEYLLIPGTETRSFFLLTRYLDMTATASWTMLEIVIVILSDKLTMNVVKICDNM